MSEVTSLHQVPKEGYEMFFCGIDVAKRKHCAVVLDDQGQVVQGALSITNDHSGFERLQQVLSTWHESLVVGLEATGHYWLALYESLTALGYPVVVLNPLQVAAYRRSGVRKVKQDTTDAFWIADYIRIANLPPTSRDTPLLLQLRELTRFRSQLVEQIGDCKRKVLCILDRVFPEYETLFSNVFLKSSRELLKQAVTADEMAQFNLSELTNLLQDASRGRFGSAKALTIQHAALRSVGVGFLTDAVRVEMRCLLQQIDLVDDQVDQIEETVAALMAQIPQHITSIPGIGPVTGAAILAEIGDIHRFDSVEKLVAYAGIDPSVYQTGEFQASHAHMSKRGSPYLRHALWQGASMAVQFDPDLRTYYQARREQGKPHGVVLGAISRKLLARIFIILKEQRPYQIR
jgi:transposase